MRLKRRIASGYAAATAADTEEEEEFEDRFKLPKFIEMLESYSAVQSSSNESVVAAAAALAVLYVIK
jgi:hypothetical protein